MMFFSLYHSAGCSSGLCSTAKECEINTKYAASNLNRVKLFLFLPLLLKSVLFKFFFLWPLFVLNQISLCPHLYLFYRVANNTNLKKGRIVNLFNRCRLLAVDLLKDIFILLIKLSFLLIALTR